jgi:hypothetical protein
MLRSIMVSMGFCLIVDVVGLMTSCSGDNGSECHKSSQAIGTCTDIQFCCEGEDQYDQCWYESGIRSWECEGADCLAAITQMNADCGGLNQKDCRPLGEVVGTCTDIQACCEGTFEDAQCWYENGEQRWDCIAADCYAAATQMASDCGG